MPCLDHVPLPGSFSLVVSELMGRRLLDLGCSEGDYLAFGGPGSIGVDVSPLSVARCEARGLSALEHDLNRLPLPLADAAFEVVLMSHVLEHVHAPVRLLAEANRLLIRGGRLIVGLPIEDSLYSRLRMRYYAGEEGHLYSFSRQNLRKLLSVCGFAARRFECNLPLVGFRPWYQINRLLGAIPLALRYQLSGAYWCVAEKIAPPMEDAGFSSYFRQREGTPP